MTIAVSRLREQLKNDGQLHKRVYLYTYGFARPEGQRALRTFSIVLLQLILSLGYGYRVLETVIKRSVVVSRFMDRISTRKV